MPFNNLRSKLFSVRSITGGNAEGYGISAMRIFGVVFRGQLILLLIFD